MEIKHKIGEHKFVTISDGVTAYVEYEINLGALIVIHTVVPAPIGGRGIAAQLVDAAYRYAEESGYLFKPVCSYAVAWLKRKSIK